MAVGHLSSSSLYPACRTPYSLVTAGDDKSVRFWQCRRTEGGVYEWGEWAMVNEATPSALPLDGRVLAVASACSTRMAIAYQPPHSLDGQALRVCLVLHSPSP